MPCVEPVTRETAAGGGDLDVALAVEALAARDARRDEVVLLQSACEVGRDARALAQAGQVDLGARVAQRRCPALRGSGAAGVELVPNHPQRQELVPLEPQDRLEPLDVALGEEPIAPSRTTRAEQTLVLEVADLRDRDVGELAAQPL